MSLCLITLTRLLPTRGTQIANGSCSGGGRAGGEVRREVMGCGAGLGENGSAPSVDPRWEGWLQIGKHGK